MPELPEVETVRATLERGVVGKRITAVEVWRKDVVRGSVNGWEGATVGGVVRHGKQLALVLERDNTGAAAVCVHLGMSGRLCLYGKSNKTLPPHTHVVWRFGDGTALAFTDPRRFGGVWAFANERMLREERWAKLGPDALAVTPGRLHAALSRTQRGLKAALLDQAVVAGLGNIYVDELLHAVRLSPETVAADPDRDQLRRLVGAMRRLLQRAIRAGGSTLRDYVDANGSPGGFALKHHVYGRGGEPCRRCKNVLRSAVIAGRTTVWCERCQPK